MEKLSRALTGLMLALFALALALTLALAAQEGLSRPGLLAALLAAGCLTALILPLSGRHDGLSRPRRNASLFPSF